MGISFFRRRLSAEGAKPESNNRWKSDLGHVGRWVASRVSRRSVGQISGQRQPGQGRVGRVEKYRTGPGGVTRGGELGVLRGARAPPERTSAPPHRQKHPLKIKEKLCKIPCDTKIEKEYG